MESQRYSLVVSCSSGNWRCCIANEVWHVRLFGALATAGLLHVQTLQLTGWSSLFLAAVVGEILDAPVSHLH